MENDFKKDQSGNEGAKSGYSKIGLNIKNIINPTGLMLMINIVLLFLSWCIIAAWKDRNKLSKLVEGSIDFYLFATLVPWIILLVIAILLVFGILYRIPLINWPLTLMINCLFWAVILLIASIVISTKKRHKIEGDQIGCKAWKCSTVEAAMALGFITTAGLALQGFLHFREFTVAGGSLRRRAKDKGDAATH